MPRIVLDCNVFVSALLSPQGSPARLTPDPGDDYLVALAQKADAQCIVSGDAHLTRLTDPSPPVPTPPEFLEGRT